MSFVLKENTDKNKTIYKNLQTGFNTLFWVMVVLLISFEILFLVRFTVPYHLTLPLFNPDSINLYQPISDKFYLWAEKSESLGYPFQINPNNKENIDKRPCIPFIRKKTDLNSGAGIAINSKNLEMNDTLHIWVWSDKECTFYINLDEDDINQNVTLEEWQYTCISKENRWNSYQIPIRKFYLNPFYHSSLGEGDKVLDITCVRHLCLTIAPGEELHLKFGEILLEKDIFSWAATWITISIAAWFAILVFYIKRKDEKEINLPFLAANQLKFILYCCVFAGINFLPIYDNLLFEKQNSVFFLSFDSGNYRIFAVGSINPSLSISGKY